MLTALQMLLATSFVHSEDSVDSQKDSAEPEKSMNQEVPIEEEREADVDNTETNKSEDEDSDQREPSSEKEEGKDEDLSQSSDSSQTAIRSEQTDEDRQDELTQDEDDKALKRQENTKIIQESGLESDECPKVVNVAEEISEPENQVERSFGVVDRFYDFVENFKQANVLNVLEASASQMDFAGGVAKSAIFEHPVSEGDSRIEYTMELPTVEDGEKLIFHSFTGLRDGIDFDYPATKPDGVHFAVEVDDERVFNGFSLTSEWQENSVDLTRFAGDMRKIALITNAGESNDANYDWALWGEPQFIKLIPRNLLIAKHEKEPRLRCGIATVTVENESVDQETKIETLETGFAFDRDLLATEAVAQIQRQVASEKTPVHISFFVDQPLLEITMLGTQQALITANENFEVQCQVTNVGLAPITRANEVSIGINRLKLKRGHSVQRITHLSSGEKKILTWQIRKFSRPTSATIGISLRYKTPNEKVNYADERSIIIHPDFPQISSQVVEQVHTFNHDEHLVLGNRNFRVVFVQGVQGFVYMVFYVAQDSEYQQIAVSTAISEICYCDAEGITQPLKITPKVYRISGNSDGESMLTFSDQVEDSDGAIWSYECRFSITKNSSRLQSSYTVSTDQNRNLIVFRGPNLYVGEGAFGSSKSFAIFPGLEFLEGDETSSSSRDAAPPINNRLVPHPYKITMPLMAIEHKKSLIGLIWDPLQKWDGEHQTLSAAFASPNWYDNQNNHLMGLFVPTPMEWLDENHLQASKPYNLLPNHELNITAEILLDGDASGLKVVDHWMDTYSLPEPPKQPRDDQEILELSRHGFMHSVWDEDSKKSRHCVGWPPLNAPGFATLLWYDYLITSDNEVKQRVLEIAQNTIQESGIGGLVSEAGCHILKWEFPFYFGSIEPAIDQIKKVIDNLIETQGEDGSWRFHPTTEQMKTLGNIGDSVLGTEAISAFKLLKFARITNDQESLHAGLKALKFMSQFTVPRGAQGWECPIYEPDILAAAYGVASYLEAYEITNNRRYLNQAEYWANTGLLFIYSWFLPNRPGMYSASIPVFGTSFYTHSWFGVPVQWCGLVYAYYLQRLARKSQQKDWGKIAEAVTISAAYQQWTDGDLKGTYPDGFYNYCTEGRGPHLNPENIMANLYALRDLDPDVSTAIIRRKNWRVHISSGAKIENKQWLQSGQLNYRLRYVQHETSYTIIVGLGFAPSVVKAANQELSLVDSLDHASGWLYRPEKEMLFIKYTHPKNIVDFEITPLVRDRLVGDTADDKNLPTEVTQVEVDDEGSAIPELPIEFTENTSHMFEEE